MCQQNETWCVNMGGRGRVQRVFRAALWPRTVNYPPHPNGPGWNCGRVRRSSGIGPPGTAGGSHGAPKNCCKCPNCCHNKQLWQQLGPNLVTNATARPAAIVQHDQHAAKLPDVSTFEPVPARMPDAAPMVPSSRRCWCRRSPFGLLQHCKTTVVDMGTRNRPRRVTPPPLPA